MDFWSVSALCLLLAALLLVGWGLFSPTHRLPAWTHRYDKLWHVMAFAGVAFLIQGIWRQATPWLVWLGMSVAGWLTEILQERYALGRRFSWGDTFANTLGAAIGLTLADPLWSFVRQLQAVAMA